MCVCVCVCVCVEGTLRVRGKMTAVDGQGGLLCLPFALATPVPATVSSLAQSRLCEKTENRRCYSCSGLRTAARATAEEEGEEEGD